MGNLISLQTPYQRLIKCLPIFLTFFPAALATVHLVLSVPSCLKPFALAFPSGVKVLCPDHCITGFFAPFGTQSATADSSEKSSLITPSNVHSLPILPHCLVLFYSSYFILFFTCLLPVCATGKSSPQKTRTLVLLFTAVSTGPRTVPSTQLQCKKYFLNEW